MLIRYWVITVRPTPLSSHRIGVALVGQDAASGRVLFKQPHNINRALTALGVSPDNLGSIHRLRHDVQALQQTQSSLDLSHRLDTKSVLQHLASHWNNAVEVSPERVMSAESLEAGMDSLQEAILGVEQATPKKRKLTQVRNDVWGAFEEAVGTRAHLFSKPQITTAGDLSQELDIAVSADGAIVELNTSFSFGGQDQRSLKNLIDSWGWKIDKLRQEGARLTTTDNDVIPLAKDTPVSATYWEPKTEEQMESFALATNRWQNLGVEAVARDHIDQHARRLANRIA